MFRRILSCLFVLSASCSITGHHWRVWLWLYNFVSDIYIHFIRSPRTFCRLNSFNSLSLYSYMRCSSSLIFLAFLSISVPLMDWGAWHWDEALQVLWGPYPIQQQTQTFPSLLFAVNVLLLDVCLVVFDAPHRTHFQVGFGFPNHVLLGLCLSVPFSLPVTASTACMFPFLCFETYSVLLLDISAYLWL